MIKRIIVFLSLLIFVQISFAQNMNFDSLSYFEFSRKMNKFSYAQQYDSIIYYIEIARPYYPEEADDLISNEIIMYLITNQEDKAFSLYSKAISKGMFFGFTPEMIQLERMNNKIGFDSLLKIDYKLQQEKQAFAKIDYRIKLPKDFDQDKSYPLFIILHEYAQNADETCETWTAPILDDNFIVACIQSPIVANMNGYQWQGAEQSSTVILGVYNQLLKEYPIDTTKILIGGFGQGGELAAYILFEQLIPSLGFFAVSPNMPSNFTPENIKRAVDKGQKAVIIAGMQDRAFAQQSAMIEAFRQNRLLYRYSPRRSLGREIPKGFEDYIRRGIKFMGFTEN